MRECSNKALLRRYIKREGDINGKLFDYVAQNANQVLFFSFEQLRDMTDSSTEELLSFFQIFGMDSLESFKEILRNIIYYEATPLGTVERPLTSIANEMILYEMRNLSEFSSRLNCEKIEQLTEDITTASRVFLFGSRIGRVYADLLTKKLKRHGIDAQLVTEKTTKDHLAMASDSDLVIAFGVSMYSRTDVLQLRLLRNRSVRIVSFTDRDSSPFALLADYYFTLPINSVDFIDSLTTGMLYVNLIGLCMALKDRKQMIADMNASLAISEERGLFY